MPANPLNAREVEELRALSGPTFPLAGIATQVYNFTPRAIATIDVLAASLRGLVATKHLTKREWLRHEAKCRSILANFDGDPHAN